MARDSAATVSVRAEMVRSLVRAGAHAIHLQLTRAEPWLSRVVPLMLAIFLASLADCAIVYTYQAAETAVLEAAAELELVSDLLTKELDRLIADNPNEPAGSLLARAVPGRTLVHGRQVIVSDARGIVASSLPSDDSPVGSLSAYLGPARVPVARSAAARAVRMTLANGREALVVARTLQGPPLEQVTFVQSVDGALEPCADWWWHWGIYLSSAGLAVVALGGVYVWQAYRARKADVACDQVRQRMDIALDSGGCGLWDWDIVRGRVYWSDSMYRMLGRAPGTGVMRVADVEDMLHPQDIPLTALAGAVESVGQQAIDHAFRARNASGDWIWLRARGQISYRQAGKPHLVGIAVDITAEKRLAEATETADVRLRDAIEAISEAFVLWDADNRLVMCNSKFQRFHNLPAEAVTVGTP